MSSDRIYGWFSLKGSEYGTSFYETPQGGSVEVTCIYTSKTDPPEGWDDYVFVGEVTKFLKTGRQGDLNWEWME